MGKGFPVIIGLLTVLALQSCGTSSDPPLPEPEQEQVTVTGSDQGYLFREGDSPVLFYQSAPKSFQGAYTRNNYLHPLWTLDGDELTEDGPEDHLHQRGIFWTWHQTYVGETRLGDAWACQDFVWEVGESKVGESSGGAQVLEVKVFWKSPAWVDESGQPKPAVQEDTRIVVHPAEPSHRIIDLEITLQALEEGVRIGGSEDEKGYGGFSARIKMPDDLVFKSEGKQVEAQTNQITAGPWMDFEGSFGGDGKKSGLAILVHPSNPGATDRWILRQKGSMQNPIYPGREPVLISKEEPTVLKYRLVVHRAPEEGLDLETLYQEYAGSD